MRLPSIILVAALLAGCSQSQPGGQRERFVPARPVTGIVYDTITGTAAGAWDAVNMPLEDLNLERRPIPEQLQKIVKDPYALPPQMLCAGIRKEIAELDALLGPDVCTPGNPTGMIVSRKGEYVEKGANAAREQAVGMVRSRADVIPFRSVVRYVSGADRHAKAVEQAYQAGKLRRAFLKGLAISLGPGCLNPPVITPVSKTAPPPALAH